MRTPDINWTIDEPDEDFVWTFWFNAQAYVVKRWGHVVDQLPQVDHVDLQMLATEALMKLGKRFDEVTVEIEGPGARKGIFWHFAKRDIDGDVLNLIHQKRRYRPDVDYLTVSREGELVERPELIRSQIHAPHETSLLPSELAEAIAAFEPAEQFTLALRFYEQMANKDIADVLGIGRSSLDERLRHAALRVLNAALRRIGSALPDELQAPPARYLTGMDNAEAWTQANYGCGLAAYLEYVSRLYAIDVSPMASMLDRANGVFSGQRVDAERLANPRSNVRNGMAMPDDQVREIRQRLAAGETGKAIAQSLGVTQPTISRIKSGEAYAYVS